MSSLTEYTFRVVLFGSFNRPVPGRGIFATRLDTATGRIETPRLVMPLLNPSWLTMHPRRRVLYAIEEHPLTSAGTRTGAIRAFDVAADGGLTPLGTAVQGSGIACHLAVAPDGGALIATNYVEGGIDAFTLGAGGEIGAHLGAVRHTGKCGPKANRQNAPHPHSTTFSPDGRFFYVADLGLDRMLAYRLDAGAIVPVAAGELALAPGTGPRHARFSPDGRHFYVLGELNGTVTHCDFDPWTGALTAKSVHSTLPENFVGENDSAELCFDAVGTTLYASNRGAFNSIAVFRRDVSSGALHRLEVVPTHGTGPRHFALSPDDRWLVCAHQLSTELVSFAVAPESGRLHAQPDVAQADHATCVLFVP